MKKSTKLLELRDEGNRLSLKTDGGLFQIYVMDDDVIRFRCTFDDEFAPEHSYALVKTAWEDELDDVLGKERTRIEPLQPKAKDCGDWWEVSTKSLIVHICKNPFGIEIYDAQDNELYHDLKERTFMVDDLGRRWHYSAIGNHDHFYGFGEKTGPLNKRYMNMRMHQTDTCGYDPRRSDPLYKHIPFYIRFNDVTTNAIGLFYNNAYDCDFDMGKEYSGYWEHYSYYCADGGDIDLFFINGPSIKEVVERYCDLTGKTALPPIGATGYAHTTMFYTEIEKNADKAILKFFDTCKKYDIPVDEFQLASGYTATNGKRHQFTWNRAKFPDPKKFALEVNKRGAFVVPNVKPGILTSHPHYDDYSQHHAFIMDETGEKPELERYWGGFASFPDFTSAEGRTTWVRHMKEALFDNGITAIWDDNCEFDIQNSAARVNGDGHPQTVAGMKPVLTNMMAYTSYNAQLENNPSRRPFVVSRAGFAGIQRYAQTWAGDNFTSWETLRYNIPTILGMGLSGVANQGCDIGGWFGERPEPELLVRWFQNGIFQPRFVTNSSNNDNSVTEPCMYPHYIPYISRAVKLRYSLTPYLYSLLRIANTSGDPVMRPLVYEFSKDSNCWDESFEFMFGPSILVANVLDKGATEKSVYLPAGTSWVDWWTGAFYEGGQTIMVPITLDSIPMFLRAGAIVPTVEGITNLHTQHSKSMSLRVIAPEIKSSFCIYEDDGVSNSYRSGVFRETTYTVTSGSCVVVDVNPQGSYQSTVESLEVNLSAHTVMPFTVVVAGKQIEKLVDLDEYNEAESGWHYDYETQTTHIKYRIPEGSYQIKVDYGVIDLVKM